VKIDITAHLNPERKRLEEYFNYMKLGVLKKVVDHIKGPTKPKYTKLAELKFSGWLIFQSAARTSADWLKTLKIWKDKEMQDYIFCFLDKNFKLNCLRFDLVICGLDDHDAIERAKEPLKNWKRTIYIN
jgi:hypothetical protein